MRKQGWVENDCHVLMFPTLLAVSSPYGNDIASVTLQPCAQPRCRQAWLVNAWRGAAAQVRLMELLRDALVLFNRLMVHNFNIFQRNIGKNATVEPEKQDDTVSGAWTMELQQSPGRHV